MMNERTFKASEAHKLEDPERLKWLPPAGVADEIAVDAGTTIADIGAGTGFFAIPLARMAGDSGHVFAVDIQPEMLDLLRKKLDQPGAVQNVELLHGTALQTGLAAASCDLVLLANIWHELDDREAVLREAARVLRGAGRIAIVDWRADLENPPGPPADHRVPRASAEATLREAGWTILKSTHVASYHYLIVAARPA
jgi:ubiquinone/menaquinone biosynthesis C-methylase UbiE